MMTDTMALFAMYTALKEMANPRGEAVVPEPEFKPFKLGKAAPVAVLAPANPPREAHTLAELGVPAALANELEVALRAMGMTRGEKVTAFTFRTPDGAAYALRTAPAKTAGDLAA